MHYHLIGICGTAMASLAGMLQARGHHVTGSDENVYPPMSTMLGVVGYCGNAGLYRPEHLTPAPDCVIVGNAIPRGNAEVEETLKRKLPYRSQAEVVKDEFIRGRRSLVVAGTHGKTTTTSIAAWVMDQGGLNPTFLVGGVAQNFGVSFRVTDSDYFIIEGDEYDTAYFDKGPKFMHYLPELAIVNNIEFDHADIYRDLEAIKLAFRRFMNLAPGNGCLIAGWDSPNVREVVSAMGSKTIHATRNLWHHGRRKVAGARYRSQRRADEFSCLSRRPPVGRVSDTADRRLQRTQFSCGNHCCRRLGS